MKHTFAIFACSVMLSMLTACAAKPPLTKPSSVDFPTVERPVAGCASDELPYDCDRRAILAMQGGYQVQFNFDETVVLKPGYERRKPKRSAGFETVILVEDTGNRISLQHILVMGGGTVTKHWRQDWIFESPMYWVYVGDQRYEQKKQNIKIPGTWTQLVYEVNDAPRYSGIGKWNHMSGVSTWTSDRSWRPLPRREYTTRNDYQLLNTEHRHTIGPQGWAHEQDSIKVMRTDGRDTALVREFGFNDYRRIKGYDFGPALAYWKSTADFWSVVRARWNDEFATHGSVTLPPPTGDEIFNKAVLELADAYAKNPQLDEYQNKLEDIFRKFVNVNTPARVAKR